MNDAYRREDFILDIRLTVRFVMKYVIYLQHDH
jgi:hypothetical protein